MTGTSYRGEMSNAVDWLAGTLPNPKGIRIAAVTQADEYGADGLAGIEEAARTHGFDLVSRLTYQLTDTDFSTQAMALKESGVKYVFMATQSRFTGRIVESCAKIGVLPSFIGGGFSFNPRIIADNPALKPVFEKHRKTSGPFAHWGEDVHGMQRMLDAVGRYAPDQKPDHLFIQGWTQAAIVTEILNRADTMNDLTRQGIIKALETMEDLDLGGLSGRLSYGATRPEPPSRQTRMFEISVDDRYPDMLKPITPFFTRGDRQESGRLSDHAEAALASPSGLVGHRPQRHLVSRGRFHAAISGDGQSALIGPGLVRPVMRNARETMRTPRTRTVPMSRRMPVGPS